jgi:hypothetical protein
LYTIFVHADAYSPNPKFEITFQARLVQTMSGTERMNQFAYPFTCGDSDAALITIYCSAEWAFKSAMLITSTI